ncbi:uncharacterized protein LOC119247245 isoform X2 [Talpa occidentalis]|uniref:uncharacterized protein LOC119247245 isoform X2 n=1 Tax=Talpa occidentalis TaxID=50954 RepID=UPI00188DCDBD|nr:uncharacterized protein LOC119247245 isoform X2 [Talpa occidentalis]
MAQRSPHPPGPAQRGSVSITPVSLSQVGSPTGRRLLYPHRLFQQCTRAAGRSRSSENSRTEWRDTGLASDCCGLQPGPSPLGTSMSTSLRWAQRPQPVPAEQDQADQPAGSHCPSCPLTAQTDWFSGSGYTRQLGLLEIQRLMEWHTRGNSEQTALAPKASVKPFNHPARALELSLQPIERGKQDSQRH